MSDVTQPKRLRDRPGYLIKQAQAAQHAEMARVLHEHGVTFAQFAVLATLAEEPGLSNAELARRAFVTPQSMSETLLDLEQRQWISRRRHPVRGRILQTELTDQGRKTLQACDAEVRALEERMLADLSADQRRQLTAELRACVAALAARNHRR